MTSTFVPRVARIQIYDHSSTNSGYDNRVGLSENLWKELIEESIVDEDEFLRATLKPFTCVSITPTKETRKNPLNKNKEKSSDSSIFSSIITYGKCQPSEFKTSQDHVCYVSQDFAKQNVLYNGTVVEIYNASPVELEEVVLGALNSESYELSLRDPSVISNHLCTSPVPIVIRHGQIYHLQSSSTNASSFDFVVLMCNPVLQGVIADHTNCIITDMSEEFSRDSYEHEQESGHSTLELDNKNELLDQNILDPKDNFLLAFLDVSKQDQLNEEESNKASSNISSSSDEESSNSEVPAPSKHKFSPLILESPFPTNLLQPTPNEKDDSESRVLVNLKELVKLGLLSGSWVLVSGPKIEKTRMCKVYAVDVPASTEHPFPPAYITPVLYFNLDFDNVTSTSEKELYIQPIRRAQSAAPIAKSISVSRIASPYSTDRNIYNASINGLTKWFEDADRIVCEGDIIPILIDEEAARLRPQKTEGDIEELEDMDIATLPIKPNLIVYFKISMMKLKNNKNCFIYGYGRRVDPNNTRLVQTGMEHAKVPALKHYFNINTETPSFFHIDSTLTSPETPYSRLLNLISSCLHPNASSLNLTCTVLLHGPRGCGKKTIAKWVAERVGVHVYEVNCFEFAGETDSKTESSLRGKIDKAVTCSPCIFLLRHIDALAKKSATLETGQEPTISTVLQDSFKQLVENFQTIGYPVLVVGTTSNIEKVPASVIGCFRHEIIFEAPDEPSRLAILENLTRETPVAPDVSLPSLATQTAALVAKDLVDLLARAGLAALERVEKIVTKEKQALKDSDLIHAGIALTAADFDEALGKARASYSDSIGAPKIPNVTWDDVGGLASVKDDILDTIQLPLEHPELFATGMKKRSGILLYGPPGTGKTLLAKAVATSCSLNFFSVKGPELLNMYIGESEANVRRVFQRARDAKPCVIFFDELDSVAPKRGEKGDSGGVMDRIVSQLLAELDGMGQGGGSSDVFVIGATNRPDLLDPALLRPGRFDKLLYLGVSEDNETQLKIIQALTRKFRLHPSLDLRAVAESCPFNYTGADFYALCSDAMLKAMSRVAEAVEAKVVNLNAHPTPNLPIPITSQYYLNHLATPKDTLVEVTQEDFQRALQELIPSVSEKELEHYRMVQMGFTQQIEGKKIEKGISTMESPLSSNYSHGNNGQSSGYANHMNDGNSHSNVDVDNYNSVNKGKGKATAD
ncbi:555_t:CDS:10 [Acaulospora morrowiae]|uniref:Peroxisomal ATPase PEX6 n=1 Tax=Acaulospora morrowiae TaxID=94023 RepID=A0A9N9ADI7_9GLOM|nr:555_t:CDS:10 [Acaulospora morrowiae]